MEIAIGIAFLRITATILNFCHPNFPQVIVRPLSESIVRQNIEIAVGIAFLCFIQLKLLLLLKYCKKYLFITACEILLSETVHMPMESTAPIISASDALHILKSAKI